MLLGRMRETQRIRDVVEGARLGRSGVLVLHGDPGIGKTALLDAAAHMDPDAIVLATVGIEGESDIPYAHLADIFRPVYRKIPQIPTRQAAALSSVFAIGPSDASDQFVVSAATLSLLSTLALRSPVVVIVDDLQWIDRASRDALTFVAHRLQAEGVAILMAVREEHAASFRLDRFPSLHVEGLDEASCRKLIAATDVAVPRSSVSRLIREAGGNPLALIDLPSLLSRQQIAGWTQGREPLPLASMLEGAFGESVGDLPRPTRAALTLLSVVGSVPTELLERMFEVGGLNLEDLNAAEQAGLIVFESNQPAFRHPLVRSAIYQTSPPGDRRRAHLLAAEVLDGSRVPNAAERRAAHLVAAGGASDEDLALSLEEAGDLELAARNFAVAGLLFEQSARLTPEVDSRVLRLIKAVHGARLAGSIEESLDLAIQARALNEARSPALDVIIDYLHCRLDMWTGRLLGGRDRLLNLVRSDQPVPVELAPYMLSDVALASIELGEGSIADQASLDAVTSSAVDGEPAPLLIATVRAFVRSLRGDPAATVELTSRQPEVEAYDPLTVDADEQLLLIVGLAHLAAEDVERAHAVLTRSVLEARSHSALGMLPFRLGRLAWVEFWRGDWSAALASSHEALALAEDTGWQGERLNSLIASARTESLTGRETECREHLAEAMVVAAATSAASYAAVAQSVLGSLEFSLGNYPTAVESFARVDEFAERNSMIDSPLLWWTGEFIESLILCDRSEEAHQLLARLDHQPGLAARPTLAAVAARCRALLHPDQFEKHAEEATALHRTTRMPFEQARTGLLLGRYLRRQRRPEAREQLTSALVVFERLGAVGWAEFARNELRAAGVRLPQPDVGLERLTPQELQVALAVSRGLSNKEVAAQLFLSVKTVEYHLSNTFHKLGITRRSQLAALIARSKDAGPDPNR